MPVGFPKNFSVNPTGTSSKAVWPVETSRTWLSSCTKVACELLGN
jgi:hypothetical protein